METTPILIEIYQTKLGKAPFAEWLNLLKDFQAIAKIEKRLAQLRLGNMGDYKFFNTINELRIDYGPG